ncbi:hypothetical protein BD626DRAFT_235977 [Schizophyllum amplum]|uniref:histidine kinase n=1 Tax=Schizophyllum amplum TaxID=97359 RepID=A0A550CJB1_9AGAR|nr:hypothetical protein BD626DRAFT_235977 [Auriculariopsis ampla]
MPARTTAPTTTSAVASSDAPFFSPPPTTPSPPRAARPRRRRATRPSTAPERDASTAFLPSFPSGHGLVLAEYEAPYVPEDPLLRPFEHMQTVREDDSDHTLADGIHRASVPTADEPSSGAGSSQDTYDLPEYNWATFMDLYAAGRWNSFRIPRFPLPHVVSSITVQHSYSEPRPQDDRPAALTKASARPISDEPSPKPATPTLNTGKIFRPNAPSLKGLPSQRFRNSFSSAPSNGYSSPIKYPTISSSHNADIQAQAATVRMASQFADVSPLALPSPEHELTDPMHGITATVPGSHLPDGHRDKYKKSNLARYEYWGGMQDVETVLEAQDDHPSPTSPSSCAESSMRTSTSPSPSNGSTACTMTTTDATSVATTESASPPWKSGIVSHDSLPPPATMPSRQVTVDDEPGDYFGTPKDNTRRMTRSPISLEASPYSSAVTSSSPSPNVVGIDTTMSAPLVPRRASLMRQVSAPLPSKIIAPPQLQRTRTPQESHIVRQSAEAEERYHKYGYLRAPKPPTEKERKRDLYKFNIWRTYSDPSFDRIVRLVYMVFQPKGIQYVTISLIDAEEEWFKSVAGFRLEGFDRASSFTGHAILQSNDEPMIVLDAHRDWRFARSPLVTGPPGIRFYAGSPLRTNNGYNIGALTVMSTNPRPDFSPSERQTLKEFAAIVMREFELWKDKIQLRIRDKIQSSMADFSRECLELNYEVGSHAAPTSGVSMEVVYDRAAKLVKQTLDVDDCKVLDFSHGDVLDTMGDEPHAESSSVSIITYQGTGVPTTSKPLTPEQLRLINSYFEKHSKGRVIEPMESILRTTFTEILPTDIQYALTVPIYNIDKRPFALICAYNLEKKDNIRYLEGHELSFLRAIGVIILSAVLKRKMILADNAKSLFISNISHELRTPLHGILGAADMLTYDGSLTDNQLASLATVKACGHSLIEVVDHVLDFTKLSGNNSRSGGVENVLVPTAVDLVTLFEESIDGCWVGHCARTLVAEESATAIGSLYSPPETDSQLPKMHVETITDIERRAEGWKVKCEKGGIRRVLMNILGNSLKFTKQGFVLVRLVELPILEDDPQDKVKLELSVTDTGKGISKEFMQSSLFHPFAQQDHHQAGTGLGLAIVKSIVQSMGGYIEVASEESKGTEVKVTFFAELVNDGKPTASEEPLKLDEDDPPVVSLHGFDNGERGTRVLRDVLTRYLTSWFGFRIDEARRGSGQIVIANNDLTPLIEAFDTRSFSQAFIVLSDSRQTPEQLSLINEYERLGGFCRVMYKPGGPSRLRAALAPCLHYLNMRRQAAEASPCGSLPMTPMSEGHARDLLVPRRPAFSRAVTAHPTALHWSIPENQDVEEEDPEIEAPTLAIGDGAATILKSSLEPETRRKGRILVIEDNVILRRVLTKWMTKKGYDFLDAADGRQGVDVYRERGPFDVVLLDLSMPVLDGFGATVEIRDLESTRNTTHARILALTGRSSLDDKRRAFEAGVDGYLVKPVEFSTLESIFRKLGLV